QGWSEIPRGQSLFDSLVIFENYPIQDAVVARREASLRMEHARGVEQSNYPLNIAVVPSAELEVLISYNSARFDDAAITRMLGHLHTLLSSMAVDPGQRLADLSLLTAAERQQLEAWNTTAQPYAQDRLAHELVARQAARTPEATALICGPEQLSYAALDGRANQLAHYLQTLGVGPETRVALYLDRSLDLVVALLAVWKAGGAYVPIDPSYPAERVAFILDDAQPVVVLTQPHLEATLPASSAQLVRLDTEAATIAAQPVTPPVSGAGLTNLAYLIYTSGTTGTPTAVAVEHGQLLQVLHASQTTFGYQATDVQPWLASVAFDIAVFELVNPLIAGGTVVIQTQAQILDLPQLVADLHGWTLLHAVPSLLREIVEQAKHVTTPNAFAGLRRIWVGGDAVPPELLADTLSVFPQAELVVLYGPTEGTIICACAVVDPLHLPTRQLIGRPLPNAQLRLYDVHGQLVPLGVAGELYLGGGSVTRGYLHRPELTAEKFVIIDGQRWYRTGDRARYLPDGTLEFLGRTDSQVKIRGYRIEVGEVEAVLAQHEAVREAVVLVRTDVPGDVRMVAYVVPQPEHIAGLGDLRDFLLNKLPAYMVPSAFVVLPALPLTPHGKVDRKALPAPEQTHAEQDDRYVAPRTPVEDVLASIWADVLRRERVGILDSFFDLGGHSLLATQLISRIREAFQVELPLRSLFELPTVEGLAQQIVMARQDMAGALAPALAPVGRDHALPLSFAQQRLWFLNQLDPSSSADNMPGALRLTGSLDRAALEHSLNEIVHRHETLRTTFVTHGGLPVQVIAPAAPVEIALIDLHGLAETERDAAVLEFATAEARRPFDLQRGPLLRAILLTLASDEHVLLLTLHHIVADGWSWGVLFRELSALYAAHTTGATAALPELPIQYADYAVWQRDWLQGDVLEAQLNYWRHQLSALEPLQLPTDHPRPPVPSSKGSSHSFTLSRALTDALLELSRREGVTLFMTLLSSWQLLLSRYSGQGDIAVGTPIANRTRGETEDLIGCFINMLVLRTDLTGSLSFREVLARVREVALGAYAHQDLPFEEVVDALQPARDLSRHPLFQVMFALQNVSMALPSFPSLTTSALSIDFGTAKLDLSLAMAETSAGLSGALEYSTDLFTAETIERMVAHFELLLTNIVVDAGRRVTELPLLLATERQLLLDAWNATAEPYAQERLVHELLAQQASRTPEATALICGAEQLSYVELEARSNQLAQHLQALGVGPETRVALYLDRSLDLVVALLAVWKAGGAYVPIDPSYPAERVAFILDDAQPVVVLTQPHLEAMLPVSSAQLVRLDADAAAIAAQPVTPPVSGAGLTNLAYLIYTSGTTGTPKAVAVEHGQLLQVLH
ncbi:MAG TPA: amino acid adenylation domain-containing protein, partial [Herpetosiphonaceae bacterium]